MYSARDWDEEDVDWDDGLVSRWLVGDINNSVDTPTLNNNLYLISQVNLGSISCSVIQDTDECGC